MRTARLFIVLFIVLANVHASAERTKVLIPVSVLNSLNGAFGSVWRSATTAVNRGSNDASLSYLMACPGTCPSGFRVFPQSTTPVLLTAGVYGRVFGTFVMVDAERADQVVIGSRVYDSSRAGLNWGAWVPAVPDGAAEKGEVDFPSVITAEPFRTNLRVYDFDPAANHAVRVKVFRPGSQGDTMLSENIVVLQPEFNGADYFAGYAEVDLTTLVPNEQSVRVQVSPVTTGLRFYPLISVTNNDTQYLTILTPPPHAQ